MDRNDNLKIIIQYYLKMPLIGALNNIFWIETKGRELPVFQIIGSMTPDMKTPEVILESKDYPKLDELLNNSKRKLPYEIPSRYRKYYISVRIVQDAHKFKVIHPKTIDRFIEKQSVIDTCLYCYEKFTYNETISKCPFCGEPIHQQLRKHPGKCIISLAGCTSSGKTVYLGVLIKIILAEIETADGLLFNHPLAVGNTGKEFENYENFKLLFEKNKMPKISTPIQDKLPPPLIYILQKKTHNISEFNRNYIPYTLVFYETGGEFLTEENSTEITQRHLAQVGGLIFLIDISSPNQMRKSKNGLVSLINNIQKVRYDGDFNVKIKIPISFAFTKFDTYFYKLKIYHSVFRNPPTKPTTNELNRISQLFEQFLIKKTDYAVRNMIIATIGMIEDFFSDYRFFPVSAIGYEPKLKQGSKEKVIDRAIEPYMVTYPLFNLMR